MTTIISPFDVFPGLETQKKKVVASTTQLCRAISWAEKDENEEEEAKLLF